MAITRYAQIMIVDTYSNLPSLAQDGDLAYVQDLKSTMIFSSATNSWTASSRTVVKKEVTTVNAKNTGTTLIYTLEPSSLNFYPILVIPRAVNVSGVTLQPTVTVGSNATSYNNIASGSLLSTALGALTSSNNMSMSSYSPALPGGTQIYANVGTGALATNYTVKFDILGYYDA